MTPLVDGLSWVLILAGGFFCITAGVGLVRLPDFFSRTHAASVADSFGAVLILLGLILQAGWSLASVKLLMIIALLLLTAPTTAHALARAALSAGMRLNPAVEHKGSPPSSS